MRPLSFRAKLAIATALCFFLALIVYGFVSGAGTRFYRITQSGSSLISTPGAQPAMPTVMFNNIVRCAAPYTEQIDVYLDKNNEPHSRAGCALILPTPAPTETP